MRKAVVRINLQGNHWSIRVEGRIAAWIFSRFFEPQVKSTVNRETVDLSERITLPPRQGRVVSATHPEWKADIEHKKGGRIVKNMPPQLKKMRLSQEHGNVPEM